MELKDLQQHWDQFGIQDPLWAILTEPSKRGGKWDLADFFQTGEGDVTADLNHLSHLPVNMSFRRALDFGCGVGRLTQALCRYFSHCDGVDIAPSMIERAKQLNRFGPQCVYHLNTSDNLRIFPDNVFDFAYSVVVLQHMRPEYSNKYIAELIRVLAPGGVIVFQLPSQNIAVRPHQRALPHAAYRASIVPSCTDLEAPAGSTISVSAEIRNNGDTPWPAADRGCWILLGNHWLAANGTMLQNDDSRAELPYTLAPGKTASINIQVHIPRDPGHYLLELDLVHEGIRWFKSNQSPTATIRVVATQPRRGPESTVDPVMEMYCIPKETVVETLRSLGTQILDVRQDDSAGPEWLSYRYYAVKGNKGQRD